MNKYMDITTIILNNYFDKIDIQAFTYFNVAMTNH